MSDVKTDTNKYILIRVRGIEENTRRTRVPEGPNPVTGNFWFKIDIEAVSRDIYLPISIASSNKPTGFVYHIEGTVQGFISGTDISCRGEGITEVTLGTLVYCKIPQGRIAAFKIRVVTQGKLGKLYRVAIRMIHYKFDPGDARYHKIPQDIHSKMVKFK